MGATKRWVRPIMKDYERAHSRYHLEDRQHKGYTLCGIGPVLAWSDNYSRDDPNPASQCEKCVAQAVINRLTRPAATEGQRRAINKAINLGMQYGMSVNQLRQLQERMDRWNVSSPSPTPASGGSSNNTPDDSA